MVQNGNSLARFASEVIIQDDGNGFDSNLKSNGFGLAGMKERVEGLAGKFELQTALNEGVHIMIELPCSEKRLE